MKDDHTKAMEAVYESVHHEYARRRRLGVEPKIKAQFEDMNDLRLMTEVAEDVVPENWEWDVVENRSTGAPMFLIYGDANRKGWQNKGLPGVPFV